MKGENLKLKPIGETQVYVGKANNGILGRWINDGGSHCEMMKKCLDNVCAMTTYDPLRLEGIQLVDARLALAKVRGEKTALFVMKTFGDDLEKAEIAVLEAEASLHTAEEKVRDKKLKLDHFEAAQSFQPASVHSPQPFQQAPFWQQAQPFQPSYSMQLPQPFSRIPTLQQTCMRNQTFNMAPLQNALLAGSLETDDISRELKSLQPDVEERNEELERAKNAVLELKEIKPSQLRAESIAQLTRAEKLHRKGKRVEEPRKNIIPYKTHRMTWGPTNMACGMNFN